MTPGLEALRIVATLKCALLRLLVQSVESHGFKMKEFEVFSRRLPLNLILFVHLRSLLLGSEILGLGRGGAGPGPMGGQLGDCDGGGQAEGASTRLVSVSCLLVPRG